jgi:arsenite methyltransferase
VTEVRELADRVKSVFRQIHDREGNTMHDFEAVDIVGWAEEAGFAEIRLDARYELKRPEPYESWDVYERSPANPLVPSLGEAIDSALSPEEAARLRAHLRARAEAGDGLERDATGYLRAVKSPIGEKKAPTGRRRP